MSVPVYIFGQIEVKDYQEYITQYGIPLLEMIGDFEGEIISAGYDGIALEGEPYGNWSVLARFPSGEAAHKFYTSDEYQPLKRLRIDKLSTGGKLFSMPATLPDFSV